jgi:hypothetical protein
MTRQAPVTASRRARTVYMAPHVWDAIERCYFEMRLRESDGPSKIEFFEQLVEDGLRTLSRRVAPTPTKSQPTRPPHPERVTTSSLPASAAANASTLVRPLDTAPSTVAPDHPRSSRQLPGPPKKRRMSPLDRLVLASDPGRPAPIHSAADPEERGEDGAPSPPTAM